MRSGDSIKAFKTIGNEVASITPIPYCKPRSIYLLKLLSPQLNSGVQAVGRVAPAGWEDIVGSTLHRPLIIVGP